MISSDRKELEVLVGILLDVLGPCSDSTKVSSPTDLQGMSRPKGFFVAPFAPDGELLEIGFWQASQLAPKWLDACRRFLDSNGQNFRASWGQQLDHIETKLTADCGAAIGSFYSGGEMAISTLYLSGTAPTVDDEVTELFLRSMRGVGLVKAAQTSAKPFESILTIGDRPLTVVVVWENPAVTESDAQVIRELSLHFAAAFFDEV